MHASWAHMTQTPFFNVQNTPEEALEGCCVPENHQECVENILGVGSAHGLGVTLTYTGKRTQSSARI